MLRITRGLFMILIGIGAASPILCNAQQGSTRGAVFIMTNAADKNEIIAYQRETDGRLYQSGEYATGGRGSGGTTDPLGSQGSLTLNQDHSLLFAVNAGSGDISVFSVRDASLWLQDRVPSGGSEPVAVAVRQNLAYVVNAGGSGSVVGFSVAPNGHLQQIKNSTTYLTASGSGGASAAFSPNGQFLLVTERVANNIDAFRVQPNGTLGPIVVNPSVDPGAFSVTFAPDGDAIVSETGPAGATDGSTISSYSILPTGKLSPVSQGVPTHGAANCWDAVTPNGKWVYVSNAASASISGFVIGNGGVLTPLDGTVVGNNPEGSTNLDIAVSSDGNYLYTLNSATGTIGIFSIEQDGTLANLGEAGNFPKTAGFNGVAAF